MKPWCLAFLVCILASPGQPQAALSHPLRYNPCAKMQYSYAGAGNAFSSWLTPGIPWPAWMELLDLHWSADEIRNTTLFEPKRIMQAIKWVVPGQTSAPSYTRPWPPGHYVPDTPASPQATRAYEKAAALYDDMNWAKAISGLDAITADKTSPYRAAAAYSAARAAINLGRYGDALKRINRLVTDPSLTEYQLAAFHLIGLRAYQSGSPQLIAAHYEEIAHLLEAPPSLICRNALSMNVSHGYKHGGWAGDLIWYIRDAFPTDHYHGEGTRRAVLDVLAMHQPFFDVLRAIAAPTPYESDSGWLRVEPKLQLEIERNTYRAIALRDSTAITDHAREEWLKTKNPLWGYALARRTASLSDFPLLEDMIARLHALPDTPAIAYSRDAFYRHFVRHAVRVLLMNGDIDQAVSFLKDKWPNVDKSLNYTFDYRKDAGAILNGGIRLFLEKFDLPNARRWASAASGLMPYTEVDQSLRPLLANSFDELLDDRVPGDGRNIYGLERHQGEMPRSVWDLLPASKLVALSRHAGLTAGEKRALLSSAWLRTYLLLGWQRSLGLLPQLRQSFPELATDIDDIQGAWLPRANSTC